MNTMVRLAWCIAWYWLAIEMWTDSEPELAFVCVVMVLVGVPFVIFGLVADVDMFQKRDQQSGQWRRRKYEDEDDEG